MKGFSEVHIWIRYVLTLVADVLSAEVYHEQ